MLLKESNCNEEFTSELIANFFPDEAANSANPQTSLVFRETDAIIGFRQKFTFRLKMDDSISSSLSERSWEAGIPNRKDLTHAQRRSISLKDPKLTPFKLRWSFGINPAVPLLNLTTDERTLIAYGTSHAAAFYDYESKEMFPLQGHQNHVKTLSTDAGGKWLLSADFGEDNVVIIWDTEIRVPICTLFNPHGDVGITAARISPNAKYVVTVGNDIVQRVNFWLWTYGRDEPDASLELTDTTTDRVKQITFNEDYPNQFVLTLESNVVFVTWNQKHEKGPLQSHHPRVIGKIRRYGVLNASTYLTKTHQVLTSTSNGFVLIWSDVLYRECFSIKTRTSNMKMHVKTIHLQSANITVIQDYEGMVVTGNSDGHLRFYDNQLKLLFWCQRFALDSISSISFNLSSSRRRPERIYSDSDLIGMSSERSILGEDDMDWEKDTGRQDINDRLPSNVTISLDLLPRLELEEDKTMSHNRMAKTDPTPSDATLQRAPFVTRDFIVFTASGRVARIDISKLECHYILHQSEAAMTAVDSHPDPDRSYVVTGNQVGRLCLYQFSKSSLMVTRMTPPLPKFADILKDEITRKEIIYVSCPQTHESMTAITALKYSPNGEFLACGMESGAMWFIHPDTLEPLNEIPFKHSSGAIQHIAFSSPMDYMAYSDNTLAVAVFRKNETDRSSENESGWSFLGKYHSHYLPIRRVFFGPPAPGSTTPRLLTLGEDQALIEYDLEHSGPYPDPGLKILQNDRIERSAIPLYVAWYPQFGIETFLVTSNSEYKFRLLNDVTRQIRATILGPTFGAPIQQMKLLPMQNLNNQAYMVFATETQIGLQILPFDGNPFMVVGIVGHPKKVTHMIISACGRFLFTLGENDPCLLMWRINTRAVDVMHRLGGVSLSPFHCLIDGGSKGWLFNEMQDLFYYAQILHQGENTTSTRIVSDKVSTTQLPNLMRAVGFYPSNYELENIMSEVAYKNYAETGQQVDEINFEEFVKLYVNHRPAFGVPLWKVKEAFHSFSTPEEEDDPNLTRAMFLDVLFRRGEQFTQEEAYTLLSLLVPHDEDNQQNEGSRSKTILPQRNFDFLPEDISYKDFIMDILGIEPPEEMRADETQN